MQDGLPDPETVRDSARSILESGEFDYAEKPGQNILQKILGWIEEFFAFFGRMHETSPALTWLILIGCVLALAAIITHAVWTLRRAMKAARLAPSSDLDPETGLSAPQLMERAAEAARKGDLVRAIRLYYRAAVVGLHERRIIRLEESETPREILGMLRTFPGERRKLESMLSIYEPCVFGFTKPSERYVEQCEKTAREFQKHART